MNLIYIEEQDKYVVEDEKNNIIGEGIIREFEASRLYDKKRMNYYIHAKSEKEDVKLFLVDSFIKIGKLKRLNYPDYDAKLYHCCFSTDLESQMFYKKVPGFIHDEGMLVLSKALGNEVSIKNQFNLVEDNLEFDKMIKNFIEEHSKIFVSVPYSVEKIRVLQKKNELKSYGLFDKDVLIGNVLILKEDDKWWIEDLFVHSDYRKLGVADKLMNTAHNFLIRQGINDVRLEVWSANKRAVSLYKKLGYVLLEESEILIGMPI